MTDQSHKLGEVLRAAREAKSVDLARAERDTRIRSHYLSALERGEYRDLPGTVYTKGFLRNYGTYLGLDSEYLSDLYRLETADTEVERRAEPSLPRPLGVRRRRSFVVTSGAVVAAILTLLVGLFVAYLAVEFVTFAGTPELRITDPAGDVAEHSDTEYVVRGETVANARVTVEGLRENPEVIADDEGRFEVGVELVPGSNVITVTAFDPVTRRDSEPRTRTITVASPVAATPAPVPLTLTEPAADATLTGPLTISGSAAPGAVVSVTATLVSPPAPNFAVVDASGEPVVLSTDPPPAPAPLELSAAADGTISGSLTLPPGTWDLAVAASETMTRRLTVLPPAGLSGTIALSGGQSYLEVDLDGAAKEGVSGTTQESGAAVEVVATESIRILAGNAGAVTVTLNSLALGAMGASGVVVEWQITPAE